MNQPGSAKTIKELQGLSDEALIEQYDQLGSNTQVGISYYEAELQRRQVERQNHLMIRLTWAIMALTAVSTLSVAIGLFK
jgi:hypothetical protein